MRKLLLINDEPGISKQLSGMLISQGIELIWTDNGHDAESLLMIYSPELILLDMDMPQLDGFDFLSNRQNLFPVILLSAVDTEAQRIKGFELGADDFLAKPFSIKELAIRIYALMRRIDRLNANNHAPVTSCIITDIDFHEDERRVQINEREVVLTQTEFNIFKYLFDRRGEVVSKMELQQRILNKEFGQFDRNLDMHVSNTRKKLARMSISKSLINTIRGKGYCFAY